MDLADDQWAELESGYRRPYDPRPAARRAVDGDEAAWAELWEELHHQGDVGRASYAAIPELVRLHGERGRAGWNLYALAVTIEQARLSGNNPAMPGWLTEHYELAWRELEERAGVDLPAATDDDLVSSLLAVLAMAKKKPLLARVARLTEEERAELLIGVGWG